MPETMPWSQLLLAAWPLWFGLLVLAVIGTCNWWAERARRPRPHRHAYAWVGYGGAGWSVYRCPCGSVDIDA